MRLKIVIKTDIIPIVYRHRVISLFKEALKRADVEYKKFLYNNSIPKPFSFNLVLPKEKEVKRGTIQIDTNFLIEDNIFYLKNPYVSLYVSALDYRFVIDLFNGLKKIKIFNFSSDTDMLVNDEKITWEIKKVIYINERPIKEGEITFKTNSPILIEDKDDNPVLFSNENFEKELNEITNRILQSPHIKGKGLEEPLKFEPIKMQKQVIKHTLKSFRYKTGKPLMYLTGNAGIFKLKGHPKDLEILYKIGIGNRTGQGFGMVEVLR